MTQIKTESMTLEELFKYMPSFQNLEYDCEYVGRNKEAGWEHDAWDVTVYFKGNEATFRYRMGIGHNGSEPELGEVLWSLAMDTKAGELSYKDFVDTFGVDANSRANYVACRRMGRRLKRLLPQSMIDELAMADN